MIEEAVDLEVFDMREAALLAKESVGKKQCHGVMMNVVMQKSNHNFQQFCDSLDDTT